ncbi:terminase large subunit [Periweissella fabaria]|uniref:terminase large subunit n=1 Tax=Periweissella fabaria TaxID=546157 RepID=UPI0032D594E0
MVSNGYQNTEIYADAAEPRLIAELKANGVRRIRKSRKIKGSIMYGIEYIQGFKVQSRR